MALAIYLGSTYLINYVVSKPSPPQRTAMGQMVKHPPANDARFRALFNAGNQAFRNGMYSDALANYLEAGDRRTNSPTINMEALKENAAERSHGYMNPQETMLGR